MKKLLIITVDKIIFSREIDQKKGECYYNKLWVKTLRWRRKIIKNWKKCLLASGASV